MPGWFRRVRHVPFRDWESIKASAADSSVRGYSGATAITNGTDRAAKTLLTGVPADAGSDFTARVRWDGTANADAKVLLYVQNLATEVWEEFDRHVTIPRARIWAASTMSSRSASGPGR